MKSKIRKTETNIASYDPEQAVHIRRDPQRKMSLAEAACYLGISVKKIRQDIVARRIHVQRLGGCRIIDPQMLERDLECITITIHARWAKRERR